MRRVTALVAVCSLSIAELAFATHASASVLAGFAESSGDDGPNWIVVAIGIVIVVGLATALKSRGGIGATGDRDTDN